MKLFTAKTYERAIGKLLPDDDRREMEAVIVDDPTAAPIIPGTGGIRKLRWAVPGHGKRGDIRTIYFHHRGPEEIYLPTAYGKSAREDLTPADKKAWAKLVAAIKKEEKGT